MDMEALKDKFSKFKKNEFFKELQDRGIKFNKGLKKERLISKLMKYEKNKNDNDSWKLKLNIFARQFNSMKASFLLLLKDIERHLIMLIYLIDYFPYWNGHTILHYLTITIAVVNAYSIF